MIILRTCSRCNRLSATDICICGLGHHFPAFGRDFPMFDISHILVLSQPDFLQRQVQSAFWSRGLSGLFKR
jgi:hypothetical protein